MTASRLLARKSIETLQRQNRDNGMRKVLGPLQLTLLGIGCIVGAGIYVMIGPAAASYAGPGVMISFLIAGAACSLTALCYAELASAVPTAGSSYAYCYAAMGEVYAWTLGWLLMLEYGLAGSLLAVGFAGYLTSLLGDFGIHLPAAISVSWLQSSVANGHISFHRSGGFNLVAAGALVCIAAVLVAGVSKAAWVNTLLVAIKIAVLASFVAIGVGAVDVQHWVPLIPPNEGGFTYGWQGVLRASSILFFAYLGFETVSTAAGETANPQRAMPIGILGALGVSTLIYIVVAAVLTGIVPFRELGVPDPIAVAVDRIGHPGFAVLIKIGALAGLSSVLLVNGYGHSRICYAMSLDGLLPTAFARLSTRFRTPWIGCILVCGISAVLAALFPLSILGDFVSIGTALAFIIVALSLMWLRTTRPDIPRPFRVPLGGFRIGRVWVGYIPTAAIVLCVAMVLPIALDIVDSARHGNVLPAAILGGYACLGVLIYSFFGMKSARLVREAASEDGQGIPESA
ncbi:MAG: amino acid permease [Rhodanobacter sp. 68-29]|nr:amino acid permease [Rhodanobacter sp.]ODU74661.1 MAG: amino acid permease [Rhodanobacter sp. SCN 69-32]OJY58124.1 MAG: amino acid permease [Rhodanobacter sp. 68-29]